MEEYIKLLYIYIYIKIIIFIFIDKFLKKIKN